MNIAYLLSLHNIVDDWCEELPYKLKMKMVITVLEYWPNVCKLNQEELKLRLLQSIILDMWTQCDNQKILP